MTQLIHRDYKRAQCVALRKTGMSYRDIAALVGTSKSSAERGVKSFEATGDFHDRRRSGRPKKLNDRSLRLLKHLVQQGERYSARDLANSLNSSLEDPVCPRTVRNYLHQMAYEYRTMITKPLLSKAHKSARLEWCYEYCN